MDDKEGIEIANIALDPGRKTAADQVCTGVGIAELAIRWTGGSRSGCRRVCASAGRFLAPASTIGSSAMVLRRTGTNSALRSPRALHIGMHTTSHQGRESAPKPFFRRAFPIGCYLGDEVSVLAHSAQVEKSRGLPPEALRLVTVKLE